MPITDINRLFSNRRAGVKMPTNSVEHRRNYQRDYDRVIFSSQFRKLQDKTQVFPLPDAVLVHNRLTHSLEVSSVSRSLGSITGQALCTKYASDLTPESVDFYLHDLYNVLAAAALCHDIGNPAFGHAGEDAISAFFRKNEHLKNFFTEAGWQDLIHFEGNANALRLISGNHRERNAGGLQLTYATICSIAKYPCESTARDKRFTHRKKFGFFQPEKEIFKGIAAETGMILENDSPLSFFRHPFVWLVEAADDICYNLMDLEDAHSLGIIEHQTCRDLLKNLVANLEFDDIDIIERRLNSLNDKDKQIEYLRSKAIGGLIMRASEIYIANFEKIADGSFQTSLFDIIAEHTPELSEIVSFSVKNVYNHIRVVEIENAGYNIMYELLAHLIPSIIMPKEKREVFDKKSVRLLPQEFNDDRQSEAERIWSVVDYVSGMTDKQATSLYRKIKGIDIGFSY